MKRKLNQVVLEKDQVVVLEEARAAVPVAPAAPANLEAVQIVVAGAAVQMAPATPAGLEAVQIVVAGVVVPVAPAVVQAAVRAILPEALLVGVVNPVDQAVARVLVVVLTGIGQVEPLALCQVDQLERVKDQVPARLDFVAIFDLVLYPIWCYEQKSL